jgi:Spy/CpxP family protein refolding chaperone
VFRKEVITMKRKMALIVSVLVVSVFMASGAFCWDGGCNSSKGDGRYKDRCADVTKDLNLTAEQEKLLKDSKTAHRAEMEAVMKTLKAKRQELKDVLSKPGVTKDQVAPVAAEIKALQAQVVDRRIDGIFTIKNILSPEQFQKLQAMKDKKEPKARGKRF